MDKQTAQAMALSGVFQAALLANQVAKGQTIPEDAFKACIESIYIINPQTPESVYQSRHRVSMGTMALCKFLKRNQKTLDPQVVRYALALLHLGQSFLGKKSLTKLMHQRLKASEHQRQHFPADHPSLLAGLGDIYTNTIGSLRFRIKIYGEARHVGNAHNINKIRALLLAGIRSVVLWHQMGGRQWHLIFKRKSLLCEAQKLLSTQPQEDITHV